jgi:hypothetical protein
MGIMKNLTEKYIRPNKKTYGHTKLLWKNTDIGYIIPDKNEHRNLNENWHFVPNGFAIRALDLVPTSESNRKKIIQNVTKQLCGK